MIMEFIDQMRREGHAVESTCRVLTEQGCPVAARTYRSWRQPGRVVAARTVSDAVVIDALVATRGTPEELYGRRKMTAFLRRSGLAVALCTVDRLMRLLGMSGARRGKPVRTTVPSKDGRRAGDLLDRNFTAAAPDRIWIADFTYVRTWAGFVYVAFIVDVFSQRILGWHAATDKRTDLVLTPLRIALWDRARHGHRVPPNQLAHHSDAGSQYTSIRFTEHLALEEIAPSIGTVGDAYDNAMMETTIGLYKTECIRPGPFHTEPLRTLSDVEYATLAWVDWWNNRRLHTTLGMITPAEAEHAHYAAATNQQQPT
jgi:putative transposase